MRRRIVASRRAALIFFLSGTAALPLPVRAAAAAEGPAAPPASASAPGEVAERGGVEEARRLIDEGRYAAAETAARAALAQAEAARGPDSVAAAEALDLFVEALWRGGKAMMPESRDLADRAVAIKEKALGLEHPAVARSLDGLVSLMKVRSEEEAAVPAGERALAIREKALGPDHLDVAESLTSLANLLRNTGAFDKARPLYDRALTIRERALGPEHPDVAATLYHLAWLLNRTGDYARAKALDERALAIREKSLGPDHPEVAASLNDLGLHLKALRDNVGAKSLFERCLAIREKMLGPDHPDVGWSLSNLGIVHRDMGDHAAAKPLLERALAIFERAFGPEDLDVAWHCNTLGNLLRAMGEYAGAKPLHERALSIYEKRLGPDDPDVGWTLGSLGNLLKEEGEYAAARSLLERAVAIREKAFGPDHPEVGGSLNNLAIVLDYTGDYAGARTLFERVLAIQERSFGPENPRLTYVLHNLGSLLYKTGDFAGARSLLERALALDEKTSGADHPSLVPTLNNLGGLLQETGDRAAARGLVERALAIAEKAFGPDHPDVAYPLTSLAFLLQETGDYGGARPLFDRALRIREEALGADHPATASSLDDVANVLAKSGDHAGARPLFERAIGIQEKVHGPDHPDVASTVERLADSRAAAGDPASARPLYERALAVTEKALGPEHPDAASILTKLAGVLFEAGETVPALQAALRAEEIGREHLRLTSRTMAESQALRYASVRASGLDVALAVAGEVADAEARARAWAAVIRSRALVLDMVAARHRKVSEISRLARQLASAGERLANLMVRGPGEEPPERYRRLLDEARQERERTERALAETSVEARQDQARSRIAFAEVASSLPSGSALVAFVRYDRPGSAAKEASSAGVPSYLAFVLRGGEKEPAALPLGAAGEIDDLVSRWKREASRGGAGAVHDSREGEKAYREAGEALRRRIWDPVAPVFKDAKRVFVVPDGALNLVSLATLPMGESEYLVESGPLVHYLSAERDLVPVGPAGAKGQGLLAVGGPSYDEGSLFQALAPKREGGPGGLATASIAAAATGAAAPPGTAVSASPGGGLRAVPAALPSFRGERSGCASFQSIRFTPLPGSAREAEEVVALWNRAGGPGLSGALTQGSAGPRTAEAVAHLSGAAASESAFKANAPGRRVLHLATHGFFLGGQCASALEASRGFGGLAEGEVKEPSGPAGENPLILSGLALAGANHRSVAGPAEEDGVLTAEEIAAMDLSGVEWAVLSACDTGVGEVRAGEGVFGLRRAFQVAGVGTLIMSLWSVDDDSAREWMRTLYEARLVKGQEIAEAVRQASLALLRERRERRLSTHPFHWGGFVAAGDWR